MYVLCMFWKVFAGKMEGECSALADDAPPPEKVQVLQPQAPQPTATILDQVQQIPADTLTQHVEQPAAHVQEEPKLIDEELPPHLQIPEVEYMEGIPIFKPTMEQFKDFKQLITIIEPYGQRAGIVKIIPPPEWIPPLREDEDELKTKLQKLRIKNPITQDITGGGLPSVQEWFEFAESEKYKAPCIGKDGKPHLSKSCTAPAQKRRRTTKKNDVALSGVLTQAQQHPLPAHNDSNTPSMVSAAHPIESSVLVNSLSCDIDMVKDGGQLDVNNGVDQNETVTNSQLVNQTTSNRATTSEAAADNIIQSTVMHPSSITMPIISSKVQTSEENTNSPKVSVPKEGTVADLSTYVPTSSTSSSSTPTSTHMHILPTPTKQDSSATNHTFTLPPIETTIVHTPRMTPSSDTESGSVTSDRGPLSASQPPLSAGPGPPIGYFSMGLGENHNINPPVSPSSQAPTTSHHTQYDWSTQHPLSSNASPATQQRKRKRYPPEPKVNGPINIDLQNFTPYYPLSYCKELERFYWRNVTYNPPLYGADMLGTLFDKDWSDSWNLNRLDNVLNRLKMEIPGVNKPYLYFGMWKATFAWHVEDMDLFSINYIHFGAPKQWYVIPPAQATRFERVAKSIYPEEAKICHDFLRHKTCVMSPQSLSSHGIQVNRLVHYAGEDSVKLDVKTLFAEDNEVVGGVEAYVEGPVEAPMEGVEMGEVGMVEKPKRVRKKKVDGEADVRKAPKAPKVPKLSCILCPSDHQNDMLATDQPGKFAHRMCALYITETTIIPNPSNPSEEIVTGIEIIPTERWRLKCIVCKALGVKKRAKKLGACIQCYKGKCTRAFHVSCAQQSGIMLTDDLQCFCKQHDGRPKLPDMLFEKIMSDGSRTPPAAMSCEFVVEEDHPEIFIEFSSPPSEIGESVEDEHPEIVVEFSSPEGEKAEPGGEVPKFVVQQFVEEGGDVERVTFAVQCQLVDLVNLPYVSGYYYTKWKVRGTSFRGVTARSTVIDHTVSWNASFEFDTTISIGKDNVLLPAELILYVKQEVNGGRSSEDIGMVTINLAEFAGSRSTSKRFLLQQARVNSIVKVVINMRLIKGDPMYIVPQGGKNEISIEGIRNIFATDEQAANRGSNNLSQILLAEEGDPTRRTSLAAGDDTHVDVVNSIFQST
ncbi:hypothetical protein HDV05_005655 [Chytridiales sp. JEL 0842]|nr:hypothetical protein HDV05_005655 [Chytridiales sp. JEL 0842]